MILVPIRWSVQSYCRYERACVPVLKACRYRELLTKKIRINNETCCSTRLHSNTTCKTLSKEWQGCTFTVWVLACALVLIDEVHSKLFGRSTDGPDVQQVLAVSCLAGCCVNLLMPICLLLMLQICRGP